MKLCPILDAGIRVFRESATTAVETVAAENETLTIGERLTEALMTTVLGMLMIFLVLSLIYGILVLFRVFLHDIPEKRKKAAQQKQAPSAATEPEPALPGNTPPAGNEDGALLAAITAAVAAYLDEEAAENGRLQTGFRVVSFTRKKSSGGWNRT